MFVATNTSGKAAAIKCDSEFTHTKILTSRAKMMLLLFHQIACLCEFIRAAATKIGFVYTLCDKRNMFRSEY